MRTSLSLEEAQALLGALPPLGTQVLPSSAALGRTLAGAVTAPLDQPPFDRSPLDGYALRSSDLAGAGRCAPAVLDVVETVYAGSVPARALGPGQAARVMTGAMLPAGCDCVAAQEDTDQGTPVSVPIFLPPRQNYIRRGEDYRAGETLFPAGARIDAAAVGVLASAGISQVAVHRRPRVAVLATGDEVVPPGVHPLPPGKIYDANQALLLARLAELGFPGAAGARVGDDPERAAAAMAELLEGCDLLITTGGVSVGDRDILHQALPLLGAERVFWKVRVKPGSPAMFSL